MKNSKLFKLGLNDLIKGLLIAFLSAFFAGLLQILELNSIPVTFEEWKPILMMGLIGAVAYLSKNLTTNSNGQIAKPEK